MATGGEANKDGSEKISGGGHETGPLGREQVLDILKRHELIIHFKKSSLFLDQEQCFTGASFRTHQGIRILAD
ncbi:hypothetical protein NDU88_004552 [Pleurodeles waltl]|uniref:Uncharacterized protein n=1 Tax=Pleurodeles waltl TaxID=8319 RepID=A0AAV7LIE2_PLEWA|nr:hypothetical protein NDU88_004552 [Pleurodeles waltl]